MTEDVGNNMTSTITTHKTTTVGSNQKIEVGANRDLLVKSNDKTKVNGNQDLTVLVCPGGARQGDEVSLHPPPFS